MKIAIFGWGSLVWDPDSLSEHCEHFLKQVGPSLPIEFSRVSGDDRLTLVVDPKDGVAVPLRVATSKRSALEDAVTDLWIREKRFSGPRVVADKHSQEDNTVGYATVRDEIRPDLQYVHEIIMPWLKTSGFDAVVWTALSANFKEKTECDFSVEAAVDYLRNLPRASDLSKASQQKALEYIIRAPEEVDTPVRKRLRELGLIPGTPSPNDPIGDQNLKEALGFLKDWVTALITISTAAIGAFAAFLPHFHDCGTQDYQRWLLALTLLCLGLTIFCGCNVLYMIPGCAQRMPFPNKDIYSLTTIDRTIGFWAGWFWRAFLASVLLILVFYASSMGNDFLVVAIFAAGLVALQAIMLPMIFGFIDWMKRALKGALPTP